ncbi:MAG: DUF1385 domain-containing protein [Armatimonadota bacterium]
MTNNNITDLIKPPRVVDASESVRRAAGIIYSSEASRILVTKNGGVAGGISEQNIAAYIASAKDPEAALDAPVENLVEPYPVFISPSVPKTDAARIFSEAGVDMLPVVDNFGGLRGVLYRSDLIALMTRNLRPPTVGGLATPLGVYLTNGTVSGGVGSAGLFLTGLSMGFMLIISKIVGERLMLMLQHLLSHKLPALMKLYSAYGVYSIGSAVISVAFLLALLKLSPLAGYHGAEHMTVHAIEAGDDLTPEAVRKYGRVHPRCGTNLLGAAAIFILITSQFSGEIAVMLAIAVVLLGRNAIGSWMQRVFTTKEPSDSQLASGIAAGNELLKRFMSRPNEVLTGFPRIWKMGFLQSAAGMTTVLAVVYVIERLTHKPLLF